MVNETRCSFSVLLEKDSERNILLEESNFNNILIKHGVNISFAPSRNQGRKGLTRYSLVITIHPEIAGRGAGRKPIPCAINMEEAIRLEEQGESKASVAEKMGISVATYYRRRKHFLEKTVASSSIKMQ